MSVFSARNPLVAAAAGGVLFLAVVMHQHFAGAVTAAVHHHVVGGDPGWDVASDVLAWSANRLFTVGDTLYAGVVEVGGAAEFDSCEVRNPIRMYTAGLSRVGLDKEGSRHFVSADPAKCKSGLKLRVDVRASVSGTSPQVEDRAAAPAPAPSASCGSQGFASLMRGLLSLACVWCVSFLGI